MLLLYFFWLGYPFDSSLSNWVILSSWSAIWLMLAAIAFLPTLHTRKTWWRYLALLPIGALSIWTLIVAYNGYLYWFYMISLPPTHGDRLRLPFFRMPYVAAIHACRFQFALTTIVLSLLIMGTVWRLWRAFSRKLDLAPGKHYGRLVMSLALAVIGLCDLAGGIILITRLYGPLYYGPQIFSYLSHQPTTLELIGLFTTCLGGPLIFLLLGLASFVERGKLVKHPASRERSLPAMEMRSSQRT